MKECISLSGRLLITAQLVRGPGALADVGTDHAYLPVWLIQNGIIGRAIACDIAEKPLLNAAETVSRFHLEDCIDLRLSDGLDCVSPDEADEIVFAGMGGTLICRLLNNALWLRDANKHLIFQPQTRAEELRQYLSDNGFEIIRESAVFEGNRVYIALDAVYTGNITERSPGYTYIGGLRDNMNEAAYEFLRRQEKRLKMKYDGCLISGDTFKAQTLSKVLAEIKEVLYV